MRKCTLSKADQAFIKRNYKTMLGTDMANTLMVDKGIVQRFLKKNGLAMSKKRMYQMRASKNVKPFTKKEDQYIIKHLPTSSIKKIAAELHRSGGYVSERAKELGLSSLIESNAINSRLKPGTVPPNKGKKQVEYMSKEAIERTKATRFKKGQKPANTKPRDGVITIRQDHKDRNGKQYKWIRVALGKWVPYHQHRWEQKNGKLPNGMCLWFKDGNTMNCSLRNLELITRAENLRRNRVNFLILPPEVRTASTLIKKLNKKIYGKEQTQ